MNNSRTFAEDSKRLVGRIHEKNSELSNGQGHRKKVPKEVDEVTKSSELSSLGATGGVWSCGNRNELSRNQNTATLNQVVC